MFPCTVDEGRWSESVSMEELFGHLCSGKEFIHDRYMRGGLREKTALSEHIPKKARYAIMRETRLHLQAMGDKVLFEIGPMPQDCKTVFKQADSQESCRKTADSQATREDSTEETREETSTGGSVPRSNDANMRLVESESMPVAEAENESQQTVSDLFDECAEKDSETYRTRFQAYRAVLHGTFDAWNEISLVSAGDNHVEEEIEL